MDDSSVTAAEWAAVTGRLSRKRNPLIRVQQGTQHSEERRGAAAKQEASDTRGRFESKAGERRNATGGGHHCYRLRFVQAPAFPRIAHVAAMHTLL